MSAETIEPAAALAARPRWSPSSQPPLASPPDPLTGHGDHRTGRAS